MLQAAKVFFALPETQKQALAIENSPHFRGYTAAGDEITRGERDWREQLDIGAERAPLSNASVEDAWKRLQGPNQWPASMPSLQPILLGWQNTLTLAAQQLLQALALALGQHANHFDEAFADTPVQHLKIIRYPGRQDHESDQGVGAHKDSGCLTLLDPQPLGRVHPAVLEALEMFSASRQVRVNVIRLAQVAGVRGLGFDGDGRIIAYDNDAEPHFMEPNPTWEKPVNRPDWVTLVYKSLGAAS